MVPPTKTALPVPEFKVKVRSLLEALSALTASLKRIPLPLLLVVVTVTFAPRTTSPVTSSVPLPKLISPVKVWSALPVEVVVSKVKLLLAPVTAPMIMSPVVSLALVSIVVAAAKRYCTEGNVIIGTVNGTGQGHRAGSIFCQTCIKDKGIISVIT